MPKPFSGTRHQPVGRERMKEHQITSSEFLGLAAVLAAPVIIGVAVFVAYWLRRRFTPALAWLRTILAVAISAAATLGLTVVAWLGSSHLPSRLLPADGMVLQFLFIPALVPGVLVTAATVGLFHLLARGSSRDPR